MSNRYQFAGISKEHKVYPDIVSLASGSAISNCSLKLNMPDLLQLQLALADWRKNIEIEKLNLEIKQLFNKKILTLDDLIKITGFQRQTIYNMVSAKRIPHSRRGRKLFFSAVEILNWLEEGDPE